MHLRKPSTQTSKRALPAAPLKPGLDHGKMLVPPGGPLVPQPAHSHQRGPPPESPRNTVPITPHLCPKTQGGSQLSAARMVRLPPSGRGWPQPRLCLVSGLIHSVLTLHPRKARPQTRSARQSRCLHCSCWSCPARLCLSKPRLSLRPGPPVRPPWDLCVCTRVQSGLESMSFFPPGECGRSFLPSRGQEPWPAPVSAVSTTDRAVRKVTVVQTWRLSHRTDLTNLLGLPPAN